VEPEVPVGGPGPNGAAGQYEQGRLDALNNVLAYTSARLQAPMQVCGRPRVSIFSAGSAPGADLFVKLERLTPDGRALNVCHGIARSSYLFRDPGYAPDTVHRWEFDLEPTCCVFAPGERLRVVLSGGAFPLYDRNPGSDVPPHLSTPSDWVQDRRLVFHDSSRPSAITLPLMP
jgi:putative CocE/NonD family hydrolase